MLLKTTSTFPLIILLFIRASHGQQQSSLPSSSFSPGSGPRTVGNSTYTLLCEQVNQNALAPYVTTHLATDIKDIDACMTLCDSFGQTCEVALWDPAQANPCTLLTAVPLSQAPPAPSGRCYAAKINGALPISASVPVSFSPGPAATSLSVSPIPFANLTAQLSLSGATSEELSSESSTAESESASTEIASVFESVEASNTSTESSEAADVTPTSTLISSQPERTNALCGSAWPDIPLKECPQADPTWGRCCSRFGFCGNETAFCGYGCLSGFGSCDSPVQAAPAQASSLSSSAVQISPSAQPLPSPAFPVWSSIPFYETYYWLPAPLLTVWPTSAIPTQPVAQSVQPLGPSIGQVSPPSYIPHFVPIPTPLLPPPFKPTPFSSSSIKLKTPSPIPPNPPVIDLNSSASSDLALETPSLETPESVLSSLRIVDVSSARVSSSGLAALVSAAVVSIEPISLESGPVSLSVPTDVSVSSPRLPTSSFVSPLPVGPNPPVIDVTRSSGPHASASTPVSFVA